LATRFHIRELFELGAEYRRRPILPFLLLLLLSGGVRSTDIHPVTATMTTCVILLVAIAAFGVIAIFGLEVIFGLRVNFIGRTFFGLLANLIGRSFFGLLIGPAQVIAKPPKL
jgi:hypothetical protein